MVLAEGTQLLDEHEGRRQHRHGDRQHVALFGAVQGRLCHEHAIETVQHVYHRFTGPRLEQPVFGRVLD